MMSPVSSGSTSGMSSDKGVISSKFNVSGSFVTAFSSTVISAASGFISLSKFRLSKLSIGSMFSTSPNSSELWVLSPSSVRVSSSVLKLSISSAGSCCKTGKSSFNSLMLPSIGSGSVKFKNSSVEFSVEDNSSILSAESSSISPAAGVS